MGLTVLAGAALILTALEGALCILMAAPLELPLAVLGGHIGRLWAPKRGRTVNALVGFAVLPVFFAVEQLTIGANSFDMVSTIDIAATEAQVWTAVVRMKDIEEEASLPFRLGMGYPIGAELSAEGVGATRYGRFSTGTAVERVTVWQPGRELELEVLSEPPAMRELSLYEHVHAPHVHGYFTTQLVTFRLEPLPGGRTRLLLESAHRLKLEPRVYWIPLAQLAIGQNDERVLRHIKRQAEQAR